MTDLNPSQFRLFHGTAHPLEGDTLLPGKHLGGSDYDINGRYGQPRDKYVSATTDESKAWQFAALAANKWGSKSPERRARVHEVEPNEQTQIGIEHIDHPDFDRNRKGSFLNPTQDNKEYVAPSFKVKETHDIRPGAQGTFPQENWNRYKRAPRNAFENTTDANHPYDKSRPETGRDSITGLQMRDGYERAREMRDAINNAQDRLF